MHGVMVGLRSERGVAQTIEVEEGVHGSHVSRPSYKMACLRFVQHPGEILKGVFVVLERSPLNFLCTFFLFLTKKQKQRDIKQARALLGWDLESLKLIMIIFIYLVTIYFILLWKFFLFVNSHNSNKVKLKMQSKTDLGLSPHHITSIVYDNNS